MLSDLLSLGPVGCLIVGSPVATIVFAVVGLAARGRAGRVASVVSLVPLALLLLAGWAAVTGERVRYLHETFHPSETTNVFAMPILRLAASVVAQRFAAGAAVMCVPLVAASIATSLARARVDRARVVALVGMIALPVWATAIAIWRVRFEGRSECDLGVRYDETLEAFAPLDAFRPWILLVAGIVTALAMLAVLRSARRASMTMRLAGLAVYALGSLAWVVTRERAADAARPIALEEAFAWDGLRAPLPSVNGPACVWRDAIVITVEGGVTTIDGMATTDVAASLRDRQFLWKQVNPGRGFDPTVAIAAPTSARATDVLRVVSAVRTAGVRRVFALAAAPRQVVETATMGPLERSQRVCLVSFTEDDARGVWGDRMR